MTLQLASVVVRRRNRCHSSPSNSRQRRRPDCSRLPVTLTTNGASAAGNSRRLSVARNNCNCAGAAGDRLRGEGRGRRNADDRCSNRFRANQRTQRVADAEAVPSDAVVDVGELTAPEPVVCDHVTRALDDGFPNASVPDDKRQLERMLNGIRLRVARNNRDLTPGRQRLLVAGMPTLNPNATAAKLCEPSLTPSVSDVDASTARIRRRRSMHRPRCASLAAANVTGRLPTPTPSLATTRTTPGSGKRRPNFFARLAHRRPPARSPDGGSDIVAVALSAALVGVSWP